MFEYLYMPTRLKILDTLVEEANSSMDGTVERCFGKDSEQFPMDSFRYTPARYNSGLFIYRETVEGSLEEYHTFDIFKRHKLRWHSGEWHTVAQTDLWDTSTGKEMPLAEYLETILPKLAGEWQDMYNGILVHYLHTPNIHWDPQTSALSFDFYDIRIDDLYRILNTCGSVTPEYRNYAVKVIHNEAIKGKIRDPKFKLARETEITLWIPETYDRDSESINKKLQADTELLVERFRARKKEREEAAIEKELFIQFLETRDIEASAILSEGETTA